MTISRIGRLKLGSAFELMKVLIKSRAVKRRAALTMKGWKNFKVSRGVCIDKCVSKNVKALGADCIDTETVVESEFVIEEVVNGAS
jgi:hypothetical protein